MAIFTRGKDAESTCSVFSSILHQVRETWNARFHIAFEFCVSLMRGPVANFVVQCTIDLQSVYDDGQTRGVNKCAICQKQRTNNMVDIICIVGCFFGEQSLFGEESGSFATATVEAATYCDLETLPFDMLRVMMEDEPVLLKAIKAQARIAYARNIMNVGRGSDAMSGQRRVSRTQSKENVLTYVHGVQKLKMDEDKDGQQEVQTQPVATKPTSPKRHSWSPKGRFRVLPTALPESSAFTASANAEGGGTGSGGSGR